MPSAETATATDTGTTGVRWQRGELILAIGVFVALMAALLPLLKVVDPSAWVAGAVFVPLAVLAAGCGARWYRLPAVAVSLNSLAWAFVAAAALGAAYGMLLVGGLREIQRIAGPRDLAGLTAVYYSLTYLGFFIPAILAALGAWIPYTTMFLAGAVLAAVSVGIVALSWRRHLPAA